MSQGAPALASLDTRRAVQIPSGAIAPGTEPVGCENCDMACELWVRMLVPVSSASSPHPVGCRYSDRAHELGGSHLPRLLPRRSAAPPRRRPVLPRLAYLTLCRSIQLLARLGRGDAAKDLEILVLRHQLAVLRRQTPRPRLEPADRALLAAVSRALPRARWSCLVRPETFCAGTGGWSPAHEPTRVVDRGGRRSTSNSSS
jgi:hypothetical protein